LEWLQSSLYVSDQNQISKITRLENSNNKSLFTKASSYTNAVFGVCVCVYRQLTGLAVLNTDIALQASIQDTFLSSFQLAM